jgi:lipopolysaccharide/colanic/teichoic acid biosynthesis glycosyltransferase
MVKRLFDVFVSFVAIILLSPVLLLAFLSVRVASPGPAIYRAQRIGRGGTPFVMHKFRTMHVRPSTGSVITSANDSRIFLAGKF